MTVALEPDLEHEIRLQAAAQGQDADAYLRQLVQAALRSPVPAIIRSKLTTEDFLASWHRWAASHDQTAPSLPDEALRRENMYDDEG